MSEESMMGPEYMANERRLNLTLRCLDMLRAARPLAAPPVAEHLDKAIAATEGAYYGYDYRDNELYIEALAALGPEVDIKLRGGM